MAGSVELDAPRGVLPELYCWLLLLVGAAAVVDANPRGTPVGKLLDPGFEIRAGGGGGAALGLQCGSVGVLAPDELSMKALTGADTRFNTGRTAWLLGWCEVALLL